MSDIKNHKWSEEKATSARTNFGLNKKRQILSPSKRKTKARVYNSRFQCPFVGCMKEVLKIRNHLRQQHKVTDKKELDSYVAEANEIPMFLDGEVRLKEGADLDTSFSDYSSEDETELVKSMGREAMAKSERFGDIDSDGDQDWLAK